MKSFLPYGRQQISEDDIEAVIKALKSDYITSGPLVGLFERKIAERTGAKYGVAVSSGTAALHAAMFALDIKPGDEVIVPPITFAATSNAVIYQGGTPVFTDVNPDTLLIDPEKVRKAITPKTKAIIGVDYAGQPCDWDALKEIAQEFSLMLVADSCHALGAEYKGRPCGSLADITVFSFHPVKHITTGEGGMAVTDDEELLEKMRRFRGHGITSTASEREKNNAWKYEMVDLGYNYRISDFQCALGLSQLDKLDDWLAKRTKLASLYSENLKNSGIEPLGLSKDSKHAWHLYVVKVPERDMIFKNMRNEGIGVNVHYTPVYLHPYYRTKFNYKEGLCPLAERVSEEILTLPLWPGMNKFDVVRVINSLKKAILVELNQNEIY